MHRWKWLMSSRLLAVLGFVALVSARTAAAQTPAEISATSPSQTIGGTFTTVTVPVVLSRSNTSPVLGFSVKVALSPEFSALNTGSDVALGDFLTDGGRATNLQVTPNGGGEYTIDGVVLGTDCGPIGTSGTLFTLTLRSTAASGTGTVTVESSTLRDCSNATIASTPAGSPASVTIDNTSPSVAVTAPNGGETWSYQSSHAITWTASDASGITSVDIAYSTNGGSSYSNVATGEPNDGTYTWAVPNTPTSNALVRVTAHDGNGNTASDASDAAFTIVSNTAPVLGAIGNQTVNELATLSFTATATDGESPPQALTFSLDAGAPAGASITSGGAFSWTPTEAQGPGDYPITVRVSDDGSPALDDFETISVHVNEVNVAPVLGAIGNQSVNELATLSFTATATDADTPPNGLTFSLDAGAPAGASITTGGAFSWTPTEAQGPGDYPITVRVTDDGTPALDDFETISVHVNEVNVAPVLGAIGNQSVNELATLSFTATATDADVPANTLTFSLDAGAPAGASITSGGAFSWTPTEAQGPGDYPVTVRVTDNGVPALDDFETISVHVDEVNVAPVLTGVPASASIPELVLYTFDADATDADLPAQTLTFSLVGAPAGASIDGSTGVFSWTPTEAQGPGVYPFTVRVTDGVANTDAGITLTVTDTNSPPSISGVPSSATIPEMALYTFDADASDTDVPAQTLTFSLVGEPTGASIDGSTGVFSWTPTEAQGPGDYAFSVRVSDGSANTDAPITLHVNEVNLAPVVTGVPATAEIPELVPYTFDADATDADIPAQTVTFSLVGAPSGASINGSTGVFSWTPTEAQGPGVYPFSVRASDGVANTDVPITITVDEVSVAAISDLNASLVRSGNDGDGTTKVLLTWSATPGGTTVEVYRARFGSYPEYDDAGGTTPPVPSYPPTAPWEATSVTTSGSTDEVSNGVSGYAGRDYWTYVAFVHASGANVSGPSNRPATPNYLLGDVSDGTVGGLGRGNNVVDGADISSLGASYGLTGAAMTSVNYLDVGPTTDHSVNGRPLTDNAINFEDLVIFALNFGTGPAPQAIVVGNAPQAASADRLVLDVPATVAAGEEFAVTLKLQGTGKVQALSAALAWDAAVVAPAGFEAGAWLTQLNGVALSPRAGAVDLALLGRRDAGFSGEGVVAVVKFRALKSGAPGITVASVAARDAGNGDVDVASSIDKALPVAPAVTMLAPAFPNPFRGETNLGFSLAQPGRVTIAVFAVDGRRVRTLTDQRWEAGVYRLKWDGRDDEGHAASAGVYFVQMATPSGRFTKRITNLR